MSAGIGDPKMKAEVRQALAAVLAWRPASVGAGTASRRGGGSPAAPDSQAVVDAACNCHVAGPFARLAGAAGLDLSPLQREQLRTAGTRVAAAHARAVEGLKLVSAALHTARVPFLVLKGGALAFTLYERADDRLMTDIDLLIRPADATRGDAGLLAAGCRRGPDLVREDFYPRFHYERGYDTPGAGRTRIDVHVRPLRPLRYSQTVPPEALWAAPQSFVVGDLRVRCPGLEDMLIHLTAHSGVHGNIRVVWLLDILHFVRRHDDAINWDTFFERTRQWRLVMPVRSGLRAAGRLFRDARLLHLARHTAGPTGWRDALTLHQAPRDEANPLARILTDLATTPGVRYRSAYLASVLLPGRPHMEQLYKLRHPGWLACAHGWRVLRAVGKPFAATARPLWPKRLNPLESPSPSG